MLLCAVLVLAAWFGAGAGALFAQGSPPAAPAQSQVPAGAAPPAATPPAAPATPTPAATPTPPAAPPVAAPALPKEVDESISKLVSVMENAEKSLARMKDLNEDIGRLRNEVETVISDSTRVADGLRPRLAAVKSQIEKLGPAPAANAPAEAPGVAGERARLNAEASALDGAIKTLELTWVRARQTIDKITDLRLELFTRSIMERMSSPLLPAMWNDVTRDLPQVARLLTYITTDWLATLGRNKAAVLLLAVCAGILYFALRSFTLWLAARRSNAHHAPTFFDRAAAAAWVAPLRALPAILTALVVYGGLEALDLLYYPSDRIAHALLRAIFIFSAVAALMTAVLAPGEPGHRLVSLSDRSATRICRVLQALGAVYAADLALTAIGRTLYLPLSMSVVQMVVIAVAFAALLVALALTPVEPAEVEGQPVAAIDRNTPVWLKLPLWVMAGLIVLATVLGYVALGRFVAQQIVMTGVVALVSALLFLAIRAFTRDQNGGTHPVGQVLQQRFGLDDARRQQLAWLTEIALTLLLAVLALPVLFLQWGFSEGEIRDWYKHALFGFEVGQFKISLFRLLLGLGLFILLLFVTRVVQRWLRDQVLAQSRMDGGVVNSIDTAIGYAGTALAALLAISYAGFDVTNLAIVAGALSVGIGFGLQSIVNNFVSGLILLIERPIKAGDWIVVGNEQGNVRRISVRSTEIETFDRASLIVPNSELIAGRVLNWTHRNTMGRIVIKLSTPPEADPRRVIAILSECAKKHPLVVEAPEPLATLDSFAPGALEFSLRVHVSNVYGGLKAQSELRIAILEALKEAGILASAPAPAAASVAPPATAAAAAGAVSAPNPAKT